MLLLTCAAYINVEVMSPEMRLHIRRVSCRIRGRSHIASLRAQVRYFKCRRTVCVLIMEATRSFFPGTSAPHRDKNISTFQNAASAPQVM